MRIRRDSTAHRALRYLSEHGPSPADLVGGFLWPDRTGRVVASGGGGDYAAQMLLGRLRAAGLVRHADNEGCSLWEITASGQKKIAHDLDRARRPSVKTFERGSAVEIRREPGDPWELATYREPADGMRASRRRGWHCVDLPDQAQPRVAWYGTREIRTRRLTVPTQRIRTTVRTQATGVDPTEEVPTC